METVLSIISIVIAITSAFFAIYTYQKTVIHDRRQATLDAYNVLQEQALDKLNEYNGTQIKNILESGDKALLREISRCLARIEHFSVGVNMKIYDEKTVYELAHGYLDKAIWFKLKPVLDKKNSREEYYANYSKLVSEMRKTEERYKGCKQ